MVLFDGIRMHNIVIVEDLINLQREESYNAPYSKFKGNERNFICFRLEHSLGHYKILVTSAEITCGSLDHMCTERVKYA